MHCRAFGSILDLALGGVRDGFLPVLGRFSAFPMSAGGSDRVDGGLCSSGRSYVMGEIHAVGEVPHVGAGDLVR